MNQLFKVCAFVAVVASQFSCMNYYKLSSTLQNISAPDKVIPAHPQRYFILRNGDSAYHMNNISNNGGSFECRLESLPEEHTVHLTQGINRKMRFKRSQADSAVLNEVHVYITPDKAVVNGEKYILEPEKIQKIEVLEKDRQKTSTSYLLGGTAITIGTLVTVLVIAAGASMASWGN